MILHGEQGFKIKKTIPTSGTLTTAGVVTGVYDKGKGALVTIETTTKDAGGDVVFTNTSGIFIRGAGGFGGERGPSTVGKNDPPDRAPDHIVEDVTRPEQAAIYASRRSQPIHIDPDFAKMGGFEKPFLHGLCTYGFVGRAIVKALCGGDPARFVSLEARFADQVYLGDKIITKMWVTSPGEAIVQAETQNGNVVLSQTKARSKREVDASR
jgi:acyl dehydratase